MISVKDLLDRIRWDSRFGQGRFVVGYEDRLEVGIVYVPFAQVRIGEGDGFSFSVVDDVGVERTIPFHRVRVVLRDGIVIWQRPSRHLSI